LIFKKLFLIYSLQHICTILKAAWLQQHHDAVIEQLLPDSRKIIFPATSLFFALKGSHRNGHSFLHEAYQKGIRNFVVSEQVSVAAYSGANIIQVKDVLAALQLLAATHRKQFFIPVIGITGSNGKTIVKEWLNQLLETDRQIVRSPKSYNSQTGVPLSVWQINQQHELGIFEAGISQSGEMDKLEKIIQPTIGVFTNIGEAHSQGFINNRQKVSEKLLLFRNVKQLVYCKDYPEINEGLAAYINQWRDAADKPPFKLFTWSTKTDATLQVTAVLKDTANTYITAVYNEQEISIEIPFTDNAAFENAINCWCVLLLLKVNNAVITQRMKMLGAVAMRLELKKGFNNCSIINDSYSADLSSLQIALDFLAQQQQHKKKTVVLSDILQSGQSDADLYMAVAKALEQKNVNRLIGIGENINRHKNTFEKIPSLETIFFTDVENFRKAFYHLSFNNESILLKGARVFHFEDISRLLEQKVHETILEINLNALAHNLKAYQQVLQPATKIMAMVKAFSYGSGSYEIANLLQFHKVDYLAVAYADEGVELRKAGITLPIMVMNPEENSFDAIVQFNLEPDIYSFNLLEAFNTFLQQQGLQQYPVHIELETGMHRLGFDKNDIPQLGNTLLKSNCKVCSVFSHLAASEEPQHDAFTHQQAGDFINAAGQLQKILGYAFIKHLANSAAILRHPQYQFNMVRLGIGLYGIDNAATGIINLQEISTLKTTIAQIKYLKEGETVGYSRKGIAEKNMTIATVRLGYADGYNRRLGNGVGKMLVHGKPAPVVGSICMDMTMIDVTGIANVQPGDEVIVFGNNLGVQQLAHLAQTIPYEIMTGISQRVKRVYFEES
jgi:Alr-MurF fusion protein